MVEALTTQGWLGHGEGSRKALLESPLHRVDVTSWPQHHVDLIDPLVLSEQELSGGKVHHRELSSKDERQTLSGEQPLHAEVQHAPRRRELDHLTDLDPAPARERFGEQDRARVRHRLEDPAPLGSERDGVARQVLLRSEIGPEELEGLARPIGEAERASHERHRRRHSRVGPHRLRHRLRKPHLPGPERHLERGLPRCALQHDAKVCEHASVDDPERGNQRDAARDPADHEAEPHGRRNVISRTYPAEKGQHLRILLATAYAPKIFTRGIARIPPAASPVAWPRLSA